MNPIFTLYPTIDYTTLQNEVEKRFNIKIDDICDLIFHGEYYNDSYKQYHFNEDITWPSPRSLSRMDDYKENLVRKYLREQLPDYNIVLIDISW